MTATVSPTHASAGRARIANRLRSLPQTAWRGRETDARWVRPAFLGLLLVTAVLYVWDLGASGYANSFYSAAVQAGASNWEAFLYGSSDAGNSITVDKPPASLWVMALSVRVFGLSGWSILLPQALMGIITVALVFAVVRRYFPPQAALIAGAVTAVTPIAVVMFRFNNPDALLLLLLTAASYCTIRHVEDGRLRWLALAGAAVGFAFLTKQLQAFLILPALIAVVLLVSPRRWLPRIGGLGVGLLALLVSAGWWVALVELVPAGMRPYVGGSTDDSFLNLTFVYNGLGRLTGGTGNGGGGGGGFGGTVGLLRLFNTEFGVQIAWLLPAALVLAVVAIVIMRRRTRTDPGRATVLLFTGSLLVTGLAFSFGEGTIHSYYAVALAPAIGVLVGVGSWLVWEHRAMLWTRIVAAAVVLGTAALGFALASQASTFLPWLRVLVVVLAVAAAAGILLVPGRRRLHVALAAVALTAMLALPIAWSVASTLTPQTGSTPSAGPQLTSAGTGGGFGTRGGMPGGQGFQGRPGSTGTAAGPAGGTGEQGGFGGPGTAGTQGGFGGPGTAGTQGGGAGDGGTTASAAIIAALQADASQYTWAAATIGSQTSATYQLESGEAVMPIGGFTGSDPSPTLARFQQYVAAGRIHYFIAGGGMGGRGGTGSSSAISTWVTSHFTATTIGGVTVYDLTAPTSGSTS